MGQPRVADPGHPSGGQTFPNKLAITSTLRFQIVNELKRRGIRLRKRYGQHLMVSEKSLEAVLDASEVNAADQILEVGTGTGILTERLSNRCARLVTVEIDPKLQEIARTLCAHQGNINWLLGDILKIPSELIRKYFDRSRSIKVISNPPYNISTPLMEYFIEWSPPPSRIVFTLQKEVVDRMRAKPGTKVYGSLTLFTQYHFNVDVAGNIPPHCFFPQPEVDSSIVILTPKTGHVLAGQEEKLFFKIVHAVFQKRRKTLANGLRAAFPDVPPKALSDAIRKCGRNPSIRGEDLGLEEYIRLTKMLAAPHSG